MSAEERQLYVINKTKQEVDGIVDGLQEENEYQEKINKNMGLTGKLMEGISKIPIVGQFTDAIQIGNNYIMLKIEKIREENIEINAEEELAKMIKYETNKQLNQFSKIFFDKLKMNYSINER